MLYYSQGKGDTDEKVKTLRPEAKHKNKNNKILTKMLKVLKTDSLEQNENN